MLTYFLLTYLISLENPIEKESEDKVPLPKFVFKVSKGFSILEDSHVSNVTGLLALLSYLQHLNIFFIYFFNPSSFVLFSLRIVHFSTSNITFVEHIL